MRYTFGLRSSMFAMLMSVMAMGLAASRVSAADAEVHDNGRFFSPAAIEEANGIIQQVKQKFQKDLAVETFSEIPERLKPELDTRGKDQFYETWVRQEARNAKLNGIIILMVKNPGRLQIGVGDQTRKKLFTAKDRDEMRDVMLEKFRAKQFDEGLTDGAKFVLKRMEENQAGRRAAPTTRPSADTEPADKGAGTEAKPDAPAKPDESSRPKPTDNSGGTSNENKTDAPPKTDAPTKADSPSPDESKPKDAPKDTDFKLTSARSVERRAA